MENVDDIYPLSPVQAGILFHSVRDPDAGAYFEQYGCTIRGALDTSRFQAAWNDVVARHPVLRTAFLWDGLDEPLQVVRRDATPDWQIEDWREQDPDTQDDGLARWLIENRRRGFDPAQAPLTRLALIRLAEDRHRFQWSFHHLLSDGWSTSLLINEAFGRYRDRGDAAPSAAPPPPPAYRDYIAWLQQQDLDAAEQYWRRLLEGFTSPTTLQLPLPRGDEPDHGHRRHERMLSQAATERLSDAARRGRVTLNTIMHGAWGLLLNRYTGDDDVVFGSTVSGRPALLPGVEQMTGLFINTLPSRVRIDADARLQKWLQSLQEEHIETRRYEYSPLIEVQRWSELPSGSDLFDTILVTENYPAAPQESPLDIADVYYDAHSSFPLALIIIPGDRLRLLLIRDAARYSDRTVERMLDHLEALLGAMGDDDDPRLGDLPRLGAVERHRLEIEWNDTARPAPDDRDLVPRQIEHRAAAHPKAAAVIHEGRTLTYGQLMERADAMARGLRRMNVGRGDRVGICMNRSPEMIVGILAALKAGAAYVPLDPTYPAARLAHMIDDACLAVLITRERLQPTIGDVSCRVACIESEALNVAPDTTDTEAVTLEPDDLAYVIYTSGSTGTPRGVMVSHANLWHSTTARSAYYEEPVGCFLLLSSFSFDSSVAGLFWTLTQGGAICIPAEARAIDTPYLCALIEKCGVTHLLGIASFYQQLLETGATQLEGLKVAIVAGEACPADLPAEHHRLLPGTRLFNEYGPTEASVWCTVHESTAAAPGDGVPIGRPIANTRLYVLDAHRDMVPIGVPGELHVAGAGITRGYWNDPERTEQRFLPDPFASNGARMYRTGDLVRYDDDGILEFLGRTDDQVKIRGHRVEPGEIESALSARADVSEAVVVATDMTDRPEADVGALESRLGRLEPDEATRLLEQIERQGGDTGAPASGRTRRTRDYELILRMRSDAFVATPRPSQRQWLVDQLLNEAAEDLEHLDRIAGNLVPGTDATTKSFEAERTALDDQQIMEDWQVPVMKAMAEQVTRSHGDVLEIGFGRGVSAGFIQDCGVRSHTIVEVNDHSVTAHFEPWRARLADRDIRLVHGRWQDHEDEIGLFDGIFFHAFPLNEQEYVEHVINSITFAGHFFPTASKHLKPGGTFTYLTTEIDSLSRRHQRLILQHFDSYTASLIRLKIPENTQDTWWADSMVIIRAEKAAGV